MDKRLRRLIPEFASPETERAYRLLGHAETSSYARMVVLIGSGFGPLLIINDYLLLGLGASFYALLAIRFLIIGFGLGLALALGRGLRLQVFDSALFAWMVAIVALGVTAAMFRPTGFLLHVLVHQALLFAAYLFVPMRYEHRLVCGLGGAAAYLGLLLATRPLTASEIVPLAVAMLLVNMIGSAAALQLERLRRLEFARLEEARIANEQLTLAKQAAEEASQAKSRFLAMLSHEVRTPLNGVLGPLQLLDGGLLDAAQRHHIGVASQSAEMLIGLLDTILDYAQLENGQHSLQSEEFDLHQWVAGAVMLIRSHAEAKGLTLSVHMDAPSSTLLRGDATRLRQVLLNLLNNAVKFTAAGKVSVTVALVPSSQEGHTDLLVAVSDTGIGIAAGTQGRIFEAFAQADETIARRFGGTGLGLAICRQIIAQMGGEISVNSRVGEGSTFQFRVSLELGESIDEPTRDGIPSTHSAPAATHRPLAILIVEDDPVNREVAAGLLTQLGHTTAAVASGEEAVFVAAAETFDAVLMDLHLPGMDGFETLRRIQSLADPSRAGVPIIALTADVTEESRRRCRQAGIAAVVAKPVLRHKLRAALDSLEMEPCNGNVTTRDEHSGNTEMQMALVDHAFLSDQWEALGLSKLVALGKLFRQTSRETLADIATAATAGDRRNVARLAHRLGSSSAALGLLRLHKLAAATEAHAAAMDVEALSRLVPNLATARDASLKALIVAARARGSATLPGAAGGQQSSAANRP